MAEIEIRVTDIITIEQTQYRVIGYRAGLFSLCEMNTKKLTIFLLPSKDLVKWATEGAARVEKSNSSNILLPDSEDENYLKKQALMRFVMQEYGPLYEKLYGKTTKTNLKKTMEDLGIQRDAAWRAIRRFLQSGLDMAAIVDGRSLRSGKRNPYKYSKKTGHPTMNALGKGVPLTDEIRTYFDEAIKDFLIGRAKTKKDAYMTMIEKHFINEEETPTGIRVSVLPDNLRPTLKQFLNYTRVRVPQEEIDKAKTSAREQRNNKRLLLSDNLQGVMGPGDLWEVDECEIDLSLVSVENPSVTVGRPIVYVMIDVYTRMIVAYSVAFDNNSVQDEALLRDMYLASTHGKKKLESACIDPRNISHLYYIREGKLMTASLNYKKTGMKEYEGMTLSEYNALHNKKKDDDAIGRETNLQMDIAIRDRQAKIVSEAQKRHLSPSTENLRANRAAEKKARAQQTPIIPKEKAAVETAAVQSLPKKGNGPILPVSASDALREFNEEEFDE